MHACYVQQSYDVLSLEADRVLVLSVLVLSISSHLFWEVIKNPEPLDLLPL